MKKTALFRKSYMLFAAFAMLFLVGFSAFYGYWNSASPSKTCASCHEIESSVNLLYKSAHRELACKECHGTALSNGFHSLKEKGMMVVHHAANKPVVSVVINRSNPNGFRVGIQQNIKISFSIKSIIQPSS